MEAYVKQTIQNNIATIAFFHPEQNSLPGTILAQLAQTITDAGSNPEVLVIILKSAATVHSAPEPVSRSSLPSMMPPREKCFSQALPM
jgi:enoyl-CoA hydratase/carnithine racemase